MRLAFFLLLLATPGAVFAETPTPTPVEVATPWIVNGHTVTEHTATYILDGTAGDILYAKLAEIAEIQGALGTLTIVVENTGGGEFGFNFKNYRGATTSHSLGGKSYFYYVEKNDTYYWTGLGGTITITWWE